MPAATLEKRLSKAVKTFWTTRNRQIDAQEKRRGNGDQGSRGAVTGGAQLDGVADLLSELLVESGIDPATIHRKKDVALPGFFRPSKGWDLVVVIDGVLLASIEVKSQVGSFGNNYNNRTEEALGSSTDLRTAYREGAFAPSARPWLGYLMLLEEAPKSLAPVRVQEPHFPVREEFRGASYARRYELFCRKLVRERLYDAACFILSDQVGGSNGKYREPSSELGFRNFVTSLTARAITHLGSP